MFSEARALARANAAPRDFFTTQMPAGDIFPNVTNANNVKVSRLYDHVLPVLQGRTPNSPRQGKRQLVAFSIIFLMPTRCYAISRARVSQRLHNA